MKNPSTKLIPGPHGFHFEFPNGFALSVQYGMDNYSDNTAGPLRGGSLTAIPPTLRHEELGEVTKVEVAVMNIQNPNASHCNFVVIPGDVMGWVSVDKLPAIIECVKRSDWTGVCHALDVKVDSSLFPKKGACN